MKEKAIVIYKNLRTGEQQDLEIPLDITANELSMALKQISEVRHASKYSYDNFLRSENPINFLKGEKTLSEYGIHNGTWILYS